MNKSKCCKTETTTHSGEEGTNCYVCMKCEKPCDLKYSHQIKVSEKHSEKEKKNKGIHEASQEKAGKNCEACDYEKSGGGFPPFQHTCCSPQPESDGVEKEADIVNPITEDCSCQCHCERRFAKPGENFPDTHTHKVKCQHYIPPKVDRMLEEIAALAYRLTKFTMLATLEPDEKKRDKYITEIIKLTEKIEEQYSLNWH